MKAKKLRFAIIFAAIACIIPLGLFASCGERVTTEYELVAPDGVTVAIFADMWDDDFETKEGIADMKYSVTAEANIAAQFTEGKEFIVAPVNVGANMHNAAKAGKNQHDYKLMNVTSWGVLYFVTTEEGFTTYEQCASPTEFLSQFDGKTVETIGLAAIPGKSAEYLFDQAGANVTLNGSDASTIQAEIARGDAVTAVFAEPAITALKNSGNEFDVLGSVSKIYKDVTDNDFPMAGLFVRSDVYDKNPALVAKVNERANESVTAFLNDIATVGAKAESIEGCSVKAAALQAAAPNMTVMYRNSADSKAAVKALLGNIGVQAADDLFLG